MEEGAGAWATTHWNPELRVNIIGTTISQSEAVKKAPVPESDTVIGTWILTMPVIGGKLTIFKKNKNLYLQHLLGVGGEITTQLSARETRAGLRFDEVPPNEVGEYYVRNKAGDLELWGKDGPFATAEKFQ